MPAPRIDSPDDYARALDRVNTLKSRQDDAAASELSELEGAIADYVSREGSPGKSKARPKD